MNKKEFIIIKLILLAERANEEAHSRYNSYIFYNKKQFYCNEAIKRLNSLKNSSIQYKKIEAPDQNGYPSTIRYFEWKDKFINKKVQFSFHNPREKGSVKGKRSIQWTGIRGECKELFKLLKKYYLTSEEEEKIIFINKN